MRMLASKINSSGTDNEIDNKGMIRRIDPEENCENDNNLENVIDS
jgi:hypothetical protein